VAALLRHHPLCPCEVWLPVDVTWTGTAAAAGLVSVVERWGNARHSRGALPDGIAVVRVDRLDDNARDSPHARAATRIQAAWRRHHACASLVPRAAAAADLAAAHLRESAAALEELAAVRASVAPDFYAGAVRAWVSAELWARRDLRLLEVRAHAELIGDLMELVVAMEATLRCEKIATAWAELALLGSLGLRHRALHRALISVDASVAVLRCERAEYTARCALAAAAFGALLQIEAGAGI
jgi:hypothetical protein